MKLKVEKSNLLICEANVYIGMEFIALTVNEQIHV